MLELLCTLFPFSDCPQQDGVYAYGAGGRTFRLELLNGSPFAAEATLSFQGPGEIAGQGPCNTWTAAQLAQYPWFEAGKIATTRRTCPDLAEERAFLSALSEATLAELLGGTLILSTPEGIELIFSAQP